METLLDVGIDVFLPQFSSQIFKAIQDIQSSQKPPFSDGVYWLEIRRYWCQGTRGMLFTVLPMLFDPLFCRLFRLDSFYINNDGTKYSIKQIKTISTDAKTGQVTVDEYFTYSEGIMHKFPGYKLDKNNLVENISDTQIDLDKHV